MRIFFLIVPEVFSLTFRVQSLQRPEDKLQGIPGVIFWMFRKSSSGIPEVDVISRVFRKLSPGYFGKCFLGMFRNVFSWNVPEVLSCLPRSIRKTGNRVLRGRFRCAMVRFFATKCKNPNETLTSWPVNGPKSKNTCHEVLGSLERVFLERSGSVLLYVPESVFPGMFRKSSSGILEVDVISRVFRKLSPGYFGKCFLGMFRIVFPEMFFLECSGKYSPVCSGMCSPGMFRKCSPVCHEVYCNWYPCTSWPLSVCYGAFLCHEVQDR